jgi:hypothetical protein
MTNTTQQQERRPQATDEQPSYILNDLDHRIIEAIMAEMRLPPQLAIIQRRDRRAHIAWARQLVAYMLNEADVPVAIIAAVLATSLTNIYYSIRSAKFRLETEPKTRDQIARIKGRVGL